MNELLWIDGEVFRCHADRLGYGDELLSREIYGTDSRHRVRKLRSSGETVLGSVRGMTARDEAAAIAAAFGQPGLEHIVNTKLVWWLRPDINGQSTWAGILPAFERAEDAELATDLLAQRTGDLFGYEVAAETFASLDIRLRYSATVLAVLPDLGQFTALLSMDDYLTYGGPAPDIVDSPAVLTLFAPAFERIAPSRGKEFSTRGAALISAAAAVQKYQHHTPHAKEVSLSDVALK